MEFILNSRKENIRMIAEAAKLYADTSVILMTSNISPFRKESDALSD